MSSLCRSKSLRLVASILAVAVLGVTWGEAARADFAPTLHKQLQAVNPAGAGTFQGDDISVVGVVINNPWDMLNASTSATRPQWQVFIQSISPLDFGGTALYMGKVHPNGTPIYDTLGWYQEMDRVNHPNGTPAPLQRGDVIRVNAGAPGLFYNGKFNVNEKHSNLVGNDFTIEILERGVALTAASISLADVKDASNNFIFDQTRLTGAEHYQGSLVHLDNLMLDDDPSKWILDGTVKVRQGELTMDLKLGLHPELLTLAPTADTKFSVTAIFDQESADYTSGYRLWLTNASDFSVVPEPSTVVLMLLGGALMYPVARQRARRAAQK